MPFAKMCSWPGCPWDALPGGTRCEHHPNVTAKARDKIYRTARWRRVRAFVLRRDDYTCQRCGANEVELGGTQYLIADHVGGDYSDPYNPEMLQTLCLYCSGTQDGGRAGLDGPVGIQR